MLPAHLFQILIVDEDVRDAAPEPVLEANIASFKATYTGADYRLYSGPELARFIGENFPAEVLATYHALQPYSFKADLGRYCLLYKLGGLYSDLSFLHTRRMEIDAETEMVVFRGIPIHPSWATSTSLIYARAGHTVLKNAITRIVKYRRSRFHGVSPLEPTGPYLLGRVLAECADWRKIKFGDSRLISMDAGGRANIVKIMPTGELVAIRNKTHNSSIGELVRARGNSYAEMWRQGQVWAEPPAKNLLKKIKSKFSK